MNSLKGQLLLSGGALFDTNFRHTAVLIAEHGTWGAVGIIMNRPMDVRVCDVVPALAQLTGDEAVLFEGGPVEPQHAVLLVDVTDPDVLDVPVFESVGFLTGDVPADVQSIVRDARVFLGHAGWGSGQLEAEIEAGAWILEPATFADVFADEPREVWRRALQRKGPPYDRIARLPFDPQAN
jgi:putative transcriptional regulator